jgi:hypothetical protein
LDARGDGQAVHLAVYARPEKLTFVDGSSQHSRKVARNNLIGVRLQLEKP